VTSSVLKTTLPDGITPLADPYWPSLLEAVLIFAVFFAQGASPVPEVNEPYYLGKAIHFWNPDWVPNDFFLNSADTHKVFYWSFGWLSLWLPPLALAWTGRVVTWALMAWSWQRLSRALVPRPWFSVLTAALFVCLLERCHMAGEWVIGGVEAKGFAYALVFLGLEALVVGRWNRMWLLLGAASAFHVLVGGWSAVAAAIAWVLLGKQRPPLRPMLPALLGGLALSLPGLLPSLGMTWGVDAETVRRANIVYVFGRLSHHLAPSYFPLAFVGRFLALMALVWLLGQLTPAQRATRRLRAFTAGAIAIAAAGMAINLLVRYDLGLAAGLLKFYWFRLSDVAVPMAAALLTAAYVDHALGMRPRAGKAVLAMAVLVAGLHVGGYVLSRPFPMLPKADAGRVRFHAWREVCAWIADPANVPPDARLLTPVMAQTFKWYAGRAEVVNWKEIPQDPQSIVQWWDQLHDIYGNQVDESQIDRDCLAGLDAARLEELGAKYRAGYVVTRRRPAVPLEVVYENQRYVVYRLKGARGLAPSP